MNLEYIYEALAYLGAAWAVFALGRWSFSLVHPKIQLKRELVDKDNLAVCIVFSGYISAIMIVIGGVVIGPSRGLLYDILDIILFGVLSIALLHLSAMINDKVLFKNFTVRHELVRDKNAGMAVVVFAYYIASALVIFGAVCGETEPVLWADILSSAIYWLIGQVILVVLATIMAKLLPYSVSKELEHNDNVAVGLGFSGLLIAIGILMMDALQAGSESIYDLAIDIGLEVIFGVILLYFIRFLTDYVLLPGRTLKQELVEQEKPNIGAGFIEGAVYVCTALLISWSL